MGLAEHTKGHPMSNSTQDGKKVRFQLDTEAREVLLLGDFTGWLDAPIKLKKSRNGPWKADVRLSPGRYEYRFLVDGAWVDDPECSCRVTNEFGSENSVRVVE